MTSLSTLTLTTDPGTTDLIVVGVTAGPDGPTVAHAPGLTIEQVGALTEAAVAVAATGKPDEVVRVPGEALGLPPVLLTGLGPADPPDPAEVLRRAAGAALRAASAQRVGVALPTDGAPELVEAVGLGALVGAYRYPGKPAGDAVHPTEVSVLVDAAHPATTDAASADPAVDPEATVDLDRAIERARVVAESVRLAKLLVDTPPNDLPPAVLAERAREELAGLPVEVEVLDEAALAAGGYGGLLGVGQGSTRPPRLVRLGYAPSDAAPSDHAEADPAADPATHLALVGKGITFDSGGLSLKPPTSMVTMKCDMAGAAAVLASVRAIATLGVPVRVTAYLALAENLPSGSAMRPGDVITAYGGKTVEVLNTDAEGRLVMMDALVRCVEDAPDRIVDIATLTGAQVVALGTRVAGVMGNDDAWRDEIVAAAGAAGELAWPMPIPEELRASLDSTVADIANLGERMGGMMTAATFLREFVPAEVPWAHLDIAGPAFLDGSPWAYNGKGATGYGVRTLVSLAERLAER